MMVKRQLLKSTLLSLDGSKFGEYLTTLLRSQDCYDKIMPGDGYLVCISGSRRIIIGYDGNLSSKESLPKALNHFKVRAPIGDAMAFTVMCEIDDDGKSMADYYDIKIIETEKLIDWMIRNGDEPSEAEVERVIKKGIDRYGQSRRKVRKGVLSRRKIKLYLPVGILSWAGGYVLRRWDLLLYSVALFFLILAGAAAWFGKDTENDNTRLSRIN